VGSRYRIDFNRWLVSDQLPLAGQIGRILNHGDFVGVYQAVDLLPEIAVSQVPEAKQAPAALALKIPDNPDLQLVLAFTGPAYPRGRRIPARRVQRLPGIGHLASLEAAKPRPTASGVVFDELTVDPGFSKRVRLMVRLVAAS
jgi:hypothetical protein